MHLPAREGFFWSTVTQSQHVRRNSVSLIVFNCCSRWGWGCKMIIDLASWETGYADGQLCRPSQCPAHLDQFSYSSGYCQGHVGAQETSGRRRPQSPSKRASQRHVGFSRLIIL
jgi:hypothetical protein